MRKLFHLFLMTAVIFGFVGLGIVGEASAKYIKVGAILNLTGPLFQWVEEQKPLPVKLEPAMPIRGSKKDERWRIMVNIDVEGDL